MSMGALKKSDIFLGIQKFPDTEKLTYTGWDSW